MIKSREYRIVLDNGSGEIDSFPFAIQDGDDEDAAIHKAMIDFVTDPYNAFRAGDTIKIMEVY